jgi:hypothetical protein
MLTLLPQYPNGQSRSPLCRQMFEKSVPCHMVGYVNRLSRRFYSFASLTAAFWCDVQNRGQCFLMLTHLLHVGQLWYALLPSSVYCGLIKAIFKSMSGQNFFICCMWIVLFSLSNIAPLYLLYQCLIYLSDLLYWSDNYRRHCIIFLKRATKHLFWHWTRKIRTFVCVSHCDICWSNK